MITLREYQNFTDTTAIYPQASTDLVYPTLGLFGEAGELAEYYKKHLRGGGGHLPEETRQAMLKECGDVLWYIARITYVVGIRDLGSWVDNRRWLPWNLDRIILNLAQAVAGIAALDPLAPRKEVVRRHAAHAVGLIDRAAQYLNSSLAEVLQANVEKLRSRQQRGVLDGSGDNR